MVSSTYYIYYIFTGLSFEIAEGGFLDIDVKITAPDGAVLYSGQRESSGIFTFSATTSGRYTYCFSNQMSTMTPKVHSLDKKIVILKQLRFK